MCRKSGPDFASGPSGTAGHVRSQEVRPEAETDTAGARPSGRPVADALRAAWQPLWAFNADVVNIDVSKVCQE